VKVKDMPVWRASLELSKEVFNITSTLPRSEDYGLTSQIRRSANSINGNIAEGFGRQTSKDKANFYIMARGSVFEPSHVKNFVTQADDSNSNNGKTCSQSIVGELHLTYLIKL